MDYVDYRLLRVSVGLSFGQWKPHYGIQTYERVEVGRPFNSFPLFLFLVVVEGLSRLVRQAIKGNFLKGVRVGRKEVESCVLQFADDTIFLCEESFSNIFIVKAILRCYELASGLKITFHKSKLAGINVARESLDWYLKSLHCTPMRVSFKYLGLEIGNTLGRSSFGSPS